LFFYLFIAGRLARYKRSILFCFLVVIGHWWLKFWSDGNGHGWMKFMFCLSFLRRLELQSRAFIDHLFYIWVNGTDRRAYWADNAISVLERLWFNDSIPPYSIPRLNERNKIAPNLIKWDINHVTLPTADPDRFRLFPFLYIRSPRCFSTKLIFWSGSDISPCRSNWNAGPHHMILACASWKYYPILRTTTH